MFHRCNETKRSITGVRVDDPSALWDAQKLPAREAYANADVISFRVEFTTSSSSSASADCRASKMPRSIPSGVESVFFVSAPTPNNLRESHPVAAEDVNHGR